MRVRACVGKFRLLRSVVAIDEANASRLSPLAMGLGGPFKDVPFEQPGRRCSGRVSYLHWLATAVCKRSMQGSTSISSRSSAFQRIPSVPCCRQLPVVCERSTSPGEAWLPNRIMRRSERLHHALARFVFCCCCRCFHSGSHAG